MEKLKKLWRLNDPPPHLGYEIGCYVKSIIGLSLLIFGLFLFSSPLFQEGVVIFIFSPILGPVGEIIFDLEKNSFGSNWIILGPAVGVTLSILGFWVLWQIKLIRMLTGSLFS